MQATSGAMLAGTTVEVWAAAMSRRRTSAGVSRVSMMER
jgi:hypothetical protein